MLRANAEPVPQCKKKSQNNLSIYAPRGIQSLNRTYNRAPDVFRFHGESVIFFFFCTPGFVFQPCLLYPLSENNRYALC